MDLEVVRWKMADDLSQEEQAFLTEHKEELNDEEKDAFKSFLTVDESKSQEDTTTTTPDNNGNNAGQQTDNPDGGGKKEDATTTEETPAITFKTEADRDAWLQAEIAKREAAKTPTPPVEDKKEEGRFFRPDETFDTADQFATALVDRLAQKAEKDRQAAQAKEEQFKSEWQTIAKEKGLPDPTTEEGQKVREQVREFGVKHGKQNYTDAFGLWSIVPSDHGGGLNFAEAQKAKAEADKKTKLTNQKKAASMVGTGGGDKTDKPKGKTYAEVHTTDLDTLVDRALTG